MMRKRRLLAMAMIALTTAASDDFGTGSLGYLKRFPVDTLKIDQCFVRGLTAGPSGARLMRSVTLDPSHGYRVTPMAMDAAARERLFLDNELRRALGRGELVLHYQPQVQTRDTRVVGAEALLRWKHPERAWISPAKFIPVAEETGQIHAIGRWVIEEALRQISTGWRWGFRCLGSMSTCLRGN